MAAKLTMLAVATLGLLVLTSNAMKLESSSEEVALEAAMEEATLKDEPLLSASEEPPLLSALEPVQSSAPAATEKMHAIINQAISIPSHVGLEDAVTQLVMSKAEAAFGATPFGDSVKKIVDLIEKEMMPKVLRRTLQTKTSWTSWQRSWRNAQLQSLPWLALLTRARLST